MTWGKIWKDINGVDFDKESYMWKYYKLLLEKTDLKGKRILEIGAGTGTNSIMMAKAGADVTCVDNSRESLKLIRKGMERAGVKCNLIFEDAFDLDFEDEFDIVTSEGVVEHFLNRRRQNILDIHTRAARKGGRVIIIVPNMHSPGYRLGKWLAEVTDTWIYGGEYPYSMKELTKRMRKTGLDIEKETGGEFLFGFGWVFAPLWLTHTKMLGKALSSGAKGPFMKVNYNNFLANRWGRVIGVVGRKK